MNFPLHNTAHIKRAVNGVLLFDKPCGLTSNAALQKVKRLFQAAKAGHTGTLDPLATGLLPVCFGEATKFSQALLDAGKAYHALIKLGQTTTTGDAEGEIIAAREAALSLPQVKAALRNFTGNISQIPPMHSALKHQGRPLYALARAGQRVERAARQIEITSLYLDAFAGDELALTVHCSKGTYIRVLAEDIGEFLGCGAHLQALRRLEVGPFALKHALTLDQLESMNLLERDAALLPVDALLRALPEIFLDEAAAAHFLRGREVLCQASDSAGNVRIYNLNQQFIGVGQITSEGRLRPKRVLANGALQRPEMKSGALNQLSKD
ncbi:MAG: tRNA pseudouridine(55) synthase TruB [Burkholderiales bacterium]